MNNNDLNIDEEPLDIYQKEPENFTKSKRGAYKKLKRDLDEEELNSKGAQKLLLNDLDRLEEEVVELKLFREKFHEADKKFHITNEQLNSLVSKEIFYTIVISIGGTTIGIAPSLWNDKSSIAIFVLILGIILIIGALFSKFLKK